MLYVDISQALRLLRDGQPFTGIQRMTFNVAYTLAQKMNDKLRLMALCPRNAAFMEAPASLLLNPENFASARVLWWRSPLQSWSSPWKEAELCKSDIVLLTECWWWGDDVVQAIEKIKAETGAGISLFLHDLIPLVRPEFVGQDFTPRFKDGLDRLLPLADQFLTNSQASKNDIERYLVASDIQREVTVIPLAHEFMPQPEIFARWQKRAINRPIAPTLQQHEKSKARPFVLCVGTIEERKNTPRLLEIWQHLSQDKSFPTPVLTLIGNWGPHANPIRQQLDENPILKENVVVLNNATDATLQWHYQHCLFTIYISQIEGWGLPIGESLWLGKPVVCARATSLPEVAGDLGLYVDPNDVSQTVEKLRAIISNPQQIEKKKEVIAKAKLRRWDDVAEDIMAQLSRLKSTRESPAA